MDYTNKNQQTQGLLFILSLCSCSSYAASPWLPAPESGTASLSYIYSTADELYEGETKASLPTDLEQHNAVFNIEYGVSDQFAVDFSLGYAQTEFQQDPTLSNADNLDGLIDPKIGFRYKVWDELEDGGITLTLHSAVIFGGGYRTGAVNSIGDDAFGLEFTVIGGKIWDNGLGVSTELGYRYREDDVPDEFIANMSAFFALSPQFNIPITLSFNYQVVDALSGIDIGSPGFSPSRFPETEEDHHLVSGGISYNFAQSLSVSANYGRVVGNLRNTADSEVVSFGLSYSF